MEANYFFNAPIFKKLAQVLHQRYYLQGEFGRTIGKSKFSQLDQEPLYRMLGLTKSAWDKKKSLNIQQFGMALQMSSFQLTIPDFVELFQPLVLKTDVLKQTEKTYQQFLSRINTIDLRFTRLLTEKQLQEWSKQSGVNHFKQVALALDKLPESYTRLPVFSYEVTKNPHAFDENQLAGRLLLQMLYQMKPIATTTVLTIEEKNQLLNQFYLLKDDIMNTVAIYGLSSETNGIINQMWHEACCERVSWNVPLKEILKVSRVQPFVGKYVLIVENSGVYSILQEKLPTVSMICSSGQFTYAFITLLRKAVVQGAQLLYVGDMDPEGLVMAQKLLDLFPENCQTIAMNYENYQQYATYHATLTDRLKQLRLITTPHLKEISEEMQQTHHVAFQEGYIEETIVAVDYIKNV